MQAKITAEGEEAKKVYQEFEEWCESQARKLGFELKTEKGEAQELGATVESERANEVSLTSKIADISETISKAEKELKEATQVREKEAADFKAEAEELSEVVALLHKAIRVLEAEQKGGGASMAQLSSANSVTQALSALVQASTLTSAQAQRVASLDLSLEEEAAQLGAPSGPVYEEHDSGIVKTLERIMQKAQSQLDEAQQTEKTALQNYEILKSSLEDEIMHAKKEMAEAKAGLAASGEEMAVAEGELAETTEEIKADEQSKEDLQHQCMAKAQDYESTRKSREEELEALAQAKKAIAESTGGPATSLLQLRAQSGAPASVQVPFAVVRRLRALGAQDSSAALTQLASRISTAVSLSTRQGADPFKKVRGMISDMLERLEQEAASDATQKAFCDKELSEAKTKKEGKDTEIEELSTKVDQMTSRSAKLKEQVATLQTELADLAQSQAEMDALRKEEHSDYVKKKAELEEGLEGVKLALKVLRDYYGQEGQEHKTSGQSSSLIAMIEVCESDFSKGLSETIATEESAAAAYKQQSGDNDVDKASKEKAVKFKTKEAAGLDKSVAENSNDLTGVQAELDAVVQYLKKLEDKCVGKPDSYEERKEAREKELTGLKEALSILEGEEALVQRSTRMLRGIRHHIAA